MAIITDLLDFVSVEDLLGEHAPGLRIPDFQRPYAWTPRIAAQLFTDVAEALRDRPDHPYVIGTIILLQRLHNNGSEARFDVVDGQQRLLTLRLMRALLRGERMRDLENGSTPIHLVYQELRRLVAGLEGSKQRSAYSDFLGAQAITLRIVTDDEDEAFQFFDSQNFRGKALRPHDLLKAYHLREMADASTSEQRAVVEQWEEAEENDLDRLFGTYLARIHWWSHNLPAQDFTATDIGLFKGVGRSTRRLPSAEYHRAAKAFLPSLQEWARPDVHEEPRRDFDRAKHQLDAPVAAGKAFFDFAAFMLEETTRLDTRVLFEGHSSDGTDFDVFRDGTRFRFCRELYVAAALYYTNKFSDADLQTRHQLFRWAYSLRLAYQNLGWKSTNNFALGLQTNLGDVNQMNLFAKIRDSLDPRDVPLENVGVPDGPVSGNKQDEALMTALQEVR